MADAEHEAATGVVAMGGSAGAVEAFAKVASGLPPSLPYAVLMALHLPATAPSVLAQIIDRSGPLPAEAARHGARLEPGRIYVAVPNRHLLSYDHRIALSEGPTENGHRPALNALFRSVAVAFGARSIGVLMSGVLDDGVLGLAAIRARGGATLCQSPADAMFPAMPSNALRAGVVDRSASAAELGGVIGELATRDIAETVSAPDAAMALENEIAMSGSVGNHLNVERLGPPSGFTCPDCHGSLQAVADGNFRCHIGHAWSGEALLTARDHEIQGALSVAVRSLQDKARLARQLAGRTRSDFMRERYRMTADEAERAVVVLRDRFTSTGAGATLDDE